MRKMKDSGIEWIGEIPESWDVCPIKYNFDIMLGKMLQPVPKSDEDQLCSYMCAVNVRWSGVDTSVEKQMWFSPKEKETYRLKNGDLLVTEGGDVAVSCIWNDELNECYFQNAIHRVRPRLNNSNHFLYYWMQVLKKSGYIDLICNKATLAHFTKDKFEVCPMPHLELEIQIRIADYLDKKCAEIDVVIAAKEKTNELLKERRQSIIYEAVTKGLDPTVPMKDSGIEWIGEIPESWSVGKLGYFIQVFNGDRSSNYPSGNDLQEEGIPFLTSSNLEKDELTLSGCKYISQEKYDSMGGFKMQINDIIYCLRGSVGKCSINLTETQGTVASSLMGSRCTNICPKFLLYVLKSSVIETQNALFMNGTCAANLSAENVVEYKIPVLDTETQIDIVSYLDKKCTELDNLITSNESTIEKLKEYRQSVIYEAVTGKIEV